MIVDYQLDWDEEIAVKLQDHVVFYRRDSELFWTDVLEGELVSFLIWVDVLPAVF